MVRRAVPAFVLLIVLALGLTAFGQDYRFRIPTFTCNMAVQKDRSLLIYYEITFTCAPGAHPIDVVDIGFPTGDYVLGSVKAEIDGVPVEGIKASTYIPIGVEVPLGSRAIAPGATGTLKVSGINPGMVFQTPARHPARPAGSRQPLPPLRLRPRKRLPTPRPWCVRLGGVHADLVRGRPAEATQLQAQLSCPRAPRRRRPLPRQAVHLVLCRR
jgi:hypothetical protein